MNRRDKVENNLSYSIADVLPTNEQLIKFAVFTNQKDFSFLKNGINNESKKRFVDYAEQCSAYNIDFEELLNALCVVKALEVSSGIELTKEQREEYQTKLSDFIKWRSEYLAESDNIDSVVDTTVVTTVGSKEGDNV